MTRQTLSSLHFNNFLLPANMKCKRQPYRVYRQERRHQPFKNIAANSWEYPSIKFGLTLIHLGIKISAISLGTFMVPSVPEVWPKESYYYASDVRLSASGLYLMIMILNR